MEFIIPWNITVPKGTNLLSAYFYLVKNGLIEQDKMAIYKYGYEILISNISVALIVRAIFSEFIESIIFLMVFAIMRKYCGGYHANTYLKCEIIFFLNTVL